VARAAVVALLLAVSPGTSPAAGSEEIRIDTRHGQRVATVLPAPRRPAPTVVVLHGAGGSPERMIRRSGFPEAAARQGFAVALPQGLDRQWNDGRDLGHVDDVGYLRRLAEDLAARGVADPGRLYIAGISNGGMMTLRMLCEASDLFAGAGTIVANMPARVGASCRPQRAVPLVMFNGTADPLIPYGGGGVGFRGQRGQVWSAERTASFLAQGHGCPEKPVPRRLRGDGPPGDGLDVVRLDWSGCKLRHGVTLYRIEGGGHQIFGRGSAFTGLLGRGTDRISAPETIMDAFASLEAQRRQGGQ
jgi:polyhydroxybutyrate depolymerase